MRLIENRLRVVSDFIIAVYISEDVLVYIVGVLIVRNFNFAAQNVVIRICENVRYFVAGFNGKNACVNIFNPCPHGTNFAPAPIDI